MTHFRFGLNVECPEVSPGSELYERLERITKELRGFLPTEYGGIGRDAVTIDRSHLEDIADAAEQLLNITRRARASVAQRGEGNG